MTSAEPESERAAATDPMEDVKRQFREALERKHGRGAEAGAAGDGRDPSKVHGTHGPVQNKRTFRRKSGG
jgi:Family of unknown function (DUF5302)